MDEKEAKTYVLTEEEKNAILVRLEFLEELLVGLQGFLSDNPDCAERADDWFAEHDIPMEDLLSKVEETEL